MRRALAAALLSGALAGVAAGCGGDSVDIFLQLDSFGCLQGQPALASLEVFVTTEENQRGKMVLRSIPRFRECIDVAPPLPLTRAAVIEVFTNRGYVARGVNAELRTTVVIQLRGSTGCAGPMPMCLLSHPIPANGEQTTISLVSTCMPSPPDHVSTLCTGLIP